MDKISAPSIFIFDSSYPSADVALVIDETKLYVVVSDRPVEPPPGHISLELEEPRGFASLCRNFRLLHITRHKMNGQKCIVIAATAVRRNQLLLNVVYSAFVCRNVVLFDGVHSKSLIQSWKLILRSAALVLARSTLGGLKARINVVLQNRRIRSLPAATAPERRLFGLYTSRRSFSLPLDRVIQEPCQRSIYGDHTRGWYLPALSNRRQRYAVQTTRHRLRDVILHVEDVNDSAVRFLFKDGRILDYPYLLGRARPTARYLVSTRGSVQSIERGTDLLHYTSGYYHWLLEGVPRILDLIDDGVDFDEYPLILPPMELFHRQVLEILGISPERQVINVGKGDWCHISECIFPTANFPFAAQGLDDPSGQPDVALLLRIRERLLGRIPNITAQKTGFSKKLYISRDMASKRKFNVRTEAVVRSILESEGFRTVFLENLPWTEQITMLSNAEFIVGLHGAGLANILFAKARSLLEFQNPLEARPYFALMARELNMNYAYIMGALDGHSSNFDNITIDPGVLKQMVRRLDLPSSGQCVY
jgi:hypothetical protein